MYTQHTHTTALYGFVEPDNPFDVYQFTTLPQWLAGARPATLDPLPEPCLQLPPPEPVAVDQLYTLQAFRCNASPRPVLMARCSQQCLARASRTRQLPEPLDPDSSLAMNE